MRSTEDNNKIKLPRTAKGKRPQYFEDPATDKLLAIVVSLVGEVSVLWDRLDTVESLIEKEQLFSRDDIETFKPSEEQSTAREERRAEYLDRVFHIIQSELDEKT
jgi:hypothetical protein